METHLLLSTIFAGAFGVIACGGVGHEGNAGAQSERSAEAAIARIDPCALVTKDEIQTAIEAKRDPSELARLKARGIAWSISTQIAPEGEARHCRIHWQGNFGSVMYETGDMTVSVYPGEYLKSEVSDMNRVRQRNGRPNLSLIRGLGNEAYFFGYSETGNPQARVGDVAVGVEFLKGKPSVDLIRAAVGRVK